MVSIRSAKYVTALPPPPKPHPAPCLHLTHPVFNPVSPTTHSSTQVPPGAEQLPGGAALQETIGWPVVENVHSTSWSIYFLCAVLVCCANRHALTSTQSTGFCVIWVCVSPGARVQVHVGLWMGGSFTDRGAAGAGRRCTTAAPRSAEPTPIQIQVRELTLRGYPSRNHNPELHSDRLFPH